MGSASRDGWAKTGVVDRAKYNDSTNF